MYVESVLPSEFGDNVRRQEIREMGSQPPRDVIHEKVRKPAIRNIGIGSRPIELRRITWHTDVRFIERKTEVNKGEQRRKIVGRINKRVAFNSTSGVPPFTKVSSKIVSKKECVNASHVYVNVQLVTRTCRHILCVWQVDRLTC